MWSVLFAGWEEWTMGRGSESGTVPVRCFAVWTDETSHSDIRERPLMSLDNQSACLSAGRVAFAT